MDQQALGEPGCFGNPYKMEDRSPDERRRVISEFATFWIDQWQNDPQLRSWWAQKVKEYDHLRLGCHCAPSPCHADVIRETLVAAFELEDTYDTIEEKV
jgi:hypothetical protein